MKVAIERGDIEAVKALIDGGSNVDMVDIVSILKMLYVV